MNTKFFGQFLLEKGVISRDQLLQALDIQREVSPLLGELAVNLSWITEKQCEKINRLQMQQDKRFGDIALELNLLTEEQVEELVDEQRKRRPYIGEVLVELGFLDSVRLKENLELHQKDRNLCENTFKDTISHCANPKFVDIVADVFPKIYQRVCKQSIALTDVIPCARQQDYMGAFWWQDIMSGDSQRILINLPTDHGLHMGSAFMRMPLPDWDELAVDAIKEFVNTLTGHVYHHLGDSESGHLVSPPVYAESLDYTLAENSPCLVFDTGKHACHLIIETL